MRLEEIRNQCGAALKEVASREHELWTLKAGERAIVARCLIALSRCTWPSGIFVDSEWLREGASGSRKGVNPDPTVPAGRNGRGSMMPDIIVHRRGSTGKADNLVAIEFKMANSPDRSRDWDRQKLQNLKDRHGYNLAWFVVIGNEAGQPKFAVEEIYPVPGVALRIV